jgi:hypothetical protein
MHAISQESKLAFLASLAAIVEQQDAIAHDRFNSSFQELSDHVFTVAEWKKLVDFATDQFSRWQAEWLFSPASSPNCEAAVEAEAWRQKWIVFSKALSDQIPEIAEPLRRQHDATVAQCIVMRKLQANAARSGARLASHLLSNAAQVLNRIGLRVIARRVMRSAMYPPKTVGRAGVRRLVEEIDRERQTLFDAAADRGVNISMEGALRHVEALRQSYLDAGDVASARAVEGVMRDFREKYGPDIPIDVAHALVQQIEAEYGNE